MKKVLFVCTGNTCRSSMAEGLFKNLIKKENIEGKFSVSSAGTAAFFPLKASENGILALEEMGIDISDHYSRLVTKELLNEVDLILTMTRAHKDYVLSLIPEDEDKVFTLAEYAANGREGDIEDPFGMNLDSYRRIRDEILKHLESIVNNS